MQTWEVTTDSMVGSFHNSVRRNPLTLLFMPLIPVIPQCEDTELVQFPLRMRDWLKNVLLQLFEHDSMSPGFLTPKQRFRVRLEWIHATWILRLPNVMATAKKVMFSPMYVSWFVDWGLSLWIKRQIHIIIIIVIIIITIQIIHLILLHLSWHSRSPYIR